MPLEPTSIAVVHSKACQASRDAKEEQLRLNDAIIDKWNRRRKTERSRSGEPQLEMRKGGMKAFNRGFKANYGPVEKATAIEGSEVRTARGSVDIKRILAVNKDSTFVDPNFSEWSERDERNGRRSLNW